MKEYLEGISVDSGLILISDINFYHKYNGVMDLSLCKTFTLKNGKYLINWSIPETFNGAINGRGLLSVESGNIVVSDPCYHIPDDTWHRVLDETDFFNNEPNGCIVLDKMGGDGEYNIILNILPLKKE